MRCRKCGAEWTGTAAEQAANCPFCGEPLMGQIPYQQAVDAFRMIVDRFGVEIYGESSRLLGLLSDVLPNTAKEKNILKTVIRLGTPKVVSSVVTENRNRSEVLKQAFQQMKHGGLDDSWCAASLFILCMPLGIDPRDLYPLEGRPHTSGFDISASASSCNSETGEDYSKKSFGDVFTLAAAGDAAAETEVGVRYYYGTGVKKDLETAIAWFAQAAEAGYAAAEFILGKLYDEGQTVSHNPEMAFEYYRRAAEKDYAPAQYALGLMYYLGQDCEKDDSEAIRWILMAADELDDSDVYVVLAMIYKESGNEDIRDENKAFRYAQKAADMGDENAYNLLGTLYELGCGTEQSYEKALHWYRLAADRGVEMAYLNVGAYYQAGLSVPKDDRKAAEYLQYGANAGNMYCLNALGMCYKNGTGVPQDYKKAFELFLDAAYAGNFAGELNTGLAYDEGEGVPEDKAEAKKWFTLAAEHGSSMAMVALGIYKEHGLPDGAPDASEAFRWYLKAAEVGDNPAAAWIVGNCCSHGLLGAETDQCTAFKWHLLAAELGHPTAQNNVACEYLKGEIVDLDYQAAVEWFEKSAAQEDMYGLSNYGTIMLNGEGIPRNTERAFSMLKRAAELGHVDAQCNLGICFFEGWGTERNLDEALKWLTAAYQAGSEAALEYLKNGYREKNGTWVKRGLFGHVPAPKQLPPPSEPIACAGGCMNPACDYLNLRIAEERAYPDDCCYCSLLEKKVYQKNKCPYYRGRFQNLLNDVLAGL